MTEQFYLDELAGLKLQAAAIRGAITALSLAGGVESYMLDTGQSVQRVTRSQVDELKSTYTETMAMIETLARRCSGVREYGYPLW